MALIITIDHPCIVRRIADLGNIPGVRLTCICSGHLLLNADLGVREELAKPSLGVMVVPTGLAWEEATHFVRAVGGGLVVPLREREPRA
jgi:hypothetical protein